MQVEDTLAYLTGSWTFSRVIVDDLTGVSGYCSGAVEVRTLGGRGRYEERGRLRLRGYDGTARRVLDLIRTDGGAVTVFFTDGRPFFDLDLVNGSCHALHHCSRDRYELEFGAGSPDLLFERWRVRGPEKDYDARTTWRRN
jgi:hypothetical protein